MTKKELKAYHPKMTAEELRQYLHFKKRGGKVAAKKGKGSYNRQEMKAVKEWQECLLNVRGVIARILRAKTCLM